LPIPDLETRESAMATTAAQSASGNRQSAVSSTTPVRRKPALDFSM